MAITILETPPKYNFVSNEIRYVLQTDGVNLPGIAIDILLFYKYPGGTTFWFPQFTVYPDREGKVFLQLATYLYSIVKPQLPPPGIGQNDKIADKQACIFWIEYKQTSDSDKEGVFNTTENNAKYALLGGVEKMKYSGGNFFNTYFAQNKPFMTWSHNFASGQAYKLRKFVFPDQEWYLTYFNFTNASNYQVTVNWMEIDGITTGSKTYGNAPTNGNLIFHIPTGMKQLAFAPAARIFWYEVLVRAGGSIAAQTYRVYVDYNVYYRHWDFIYFNSLGGIDSVRLRGDFDKTYDITSDEIQSISYNEIYNAYNPNSPLRTTAPVRRDTYKGDVGFAHNRYDQEILIELAMSRGIYENVGGRWIRVISLKKSNSLGLTRDTKRSFSLDWQYAYEETVYTPTWINLGAGSIDNNVPPVVTCVGATINGFTGMPDAKEGELYTFDIKMSGTKPFMFDNIVKADWLNWSIVNGDTIHLQGTPLITGSSTVYTLAFDFTNCSPNIGHFENEINVIPAALQVQSTGWGDRTVDGSDASNAYETRQISGYPGTVVTITMTARTVTNPNGHIVVNATEAFVGNTWNLTLDSNGHANVFVTLSGDPSATGTVVTGKLEITNVSNGTVNADYSSYQFSKVF